MGGMRIVGISVDKRPKSAPKVQEVLTRFGDEIISRYGVHDVGERDRGLITLNFVGNDERLTQFKNEISSLEGVKIKHIDIDMD